ncbi:hypothetical protein SAMN04488491_1491 [Psychrobacter sp. LV10R520-6]|nr:hypothetical protein SAMN04488491_1491 [Psychrobacter sp. LV10R520-6]
MYVELIVNKARCHYYYFSSLYKTGINYKQSIWYSTSVLPYQYVNICEVARQFVTFLLSCKSKKPSVGKFPHLV